MQSDILRIYRSLHTWTGVIAGLALFIAFYAGALTMFKPTLDRWASPADTTVPTVEADRLPGLVRSVLAQHPEAGREFMLHLNPAENRPASLSWEVRHAAPGTEEHHHGGPAQRMLAGLDADDTLVVQSSRPSPMAELIDRLHQTAGIPGGDGHDLVGGYVMGVVSIFYVLALVSGLIIFLPVIARELFALRLGKSVKRFWRDAHSLIGITALPFHLVIGLTAIVFSLHDFFYAGLQQTVYGDKPLFSFSRPGPGGEARDPREMLPPQQLVENLAESAPEFRVTEMKYQNIFSEHARVWVMGEADGHMMRGGDFGFAILDPYSGAMISSDYLPGHQEGWVAAVTVFFGLHFGNFGGMTVQWVYFLLGIGGAFLFYSGNLLWIENRRRKEHTGTAFLANATVGVSWGSVAGVAAAMVVGKWLHGYVEDSAMLYLWTYYSVFLSAVAWSFYTGAARALPKLLWLCAVTVWAIPLTGLLAWLFPSLPAWVHLHPETLAVEFTALVIGTLFAVAAFGREGTLKRVKATRPI